MKRFRLFLPALAATLFSGLSLRLSGAEGALMASGRDAEILRRFDRNGDGRIDDDERADAYEAMRRERTDRQANRAVAANPEVREKFRQRFLAMFDRNHDGRLDEDERVTVNRVLAETSRGEAGALREELMRLFDGNADGKLDESEKAALMEFIAAGKSLASDAGGAFRSELLRRIDRNGDGRVDEAEWVAAESVLRARMEANPARLRQMDRNGNGHIDDDEWAAAKTQLMRWLNEPPQSAPSEVSAERLKQVEQELRQRREGRASPAR
jgi:Ca2+-binding EF-hand superfamily protein